MSPRNSSVDKSTASETWRGRHVVAVLGAALAMRIAVILTVLRCYPPQWLFTRGIEMGLLAKSVLAGEGLSSPFGGHTGPTAFIAPVYPLAVALVFKIFGSFTIASAVVVMLAQTALNLVTIWLIMHIGERIFDRMAAITAGLIWACSLPLIWIPTIFWETSLSCCLLLGLLTLALKYSGGGRVTRGKWISLGAYSALAGLINPALLPSLLAISSWLAFQKRRDLSWSPVLGLVAFTVVFAPWPIRNAVVFHAFIPLRTTVGFELWMGNHAGADGFLDESLFPMYNRAELADYVARGEVSYSANKAKLAREFLYERPGLFVRMTAVRVFRFWTGTGSRNGSRLFGLHATFTTLFGFAGLWLLGRSGRPADALLFLLPMLLFPIPYVITHAEFRYRLILDPTLTLLSGFAVTECCHSLTLLKTAKSEDNKLSNGIGDDAEAGTLALTLADQEPSKVAPFAEGAPEAGTLRLWPILLMALVLRTLAACFMFRRNPNLWFYDQASELGCLARSVLSGHGLSSPFCGSTGPSAFLAPGYPLLVSFVYRIFGFSSVRAAEVLVGLQVLCGVAVVALVMLIAKRLFDFRTAYLAGALCAISPTMIWLPALFWETSLSTLFITGAILLTLHCVDKAQPLRWIALGVYFAVGMLLNPALLLTFVGLGMWATHRRRPHTLWAPLLAAAICIVCFSAWPIRNAMALHAFIPLRSNLGYELWQGNRSGSQGFFTPETYLNSDRTEYERYAAIGEIAYMQEKKTIAMATIEADPVRFVRLSLKRAVVFWTALGGHGISWIVISEITLMSLGAGAAVTTLLFQDDEHARIFLIPFLFFPLPYYVTHPDFRFRLVLEPLALLLTVWVLRRAYTKLMGQRAETSM